MLFPRGSSLMFSRGVRCTSAKDATRSAGAQIASSERSEKHFLWDFLWGLCLAVSTSASAIACPYEWLTRFYPSELGVIRVSAEFFRSSSNFLRLSFAVLIVRHNWGNCYIHHTQENANVCWCSAITYKYLFWEKEHIVNDEKKNEAVEASSF